MSFYETYREYTRVIEEMDLTELGAYKKGQAPDGAEVLLTVAVVHNVTLADRGGKLETLWFDIPEPKDKQNQTGGGYVLDGVVVEGHEWWPTQSGPSTIRSVLTTVTSTKLDERSKAAAGLVNLLKQEQLLTYLE